MRNPFYKHKPDDLGKLVIVNEETLEEFSVDIDSLIKLLFIEIDKLSSKIKSLRDDVDDLTDFVEDSLD